MIDTRQKIVYFAISSAFFTWRSQIVWNHLAHITVIKSVLNFFLLILNCAFTGKYCLLWRQVYAVDWSPDGQRVASGGKDKVLKMWVHCLCFRLSKLSIITIIRRAFLHSTVQIATNDQMRCKRYATQQEYWMSGCKILATNGRPWSCQYHTLPQPLSFASNPHSSYHV